MIYNLCNCYRFLFVLLFFFFQVIIPLRASCHPDDIKVLMQIKDHFSGWNGDDCCNWDVVTCSDDENHLSRITGFHLTGFFEASIANVSGEIPRVIGDLPFLEILDFDNLPKLTGSIPETIANLSNLMVITLADVNLTGPIPEFLSQIKTLQSIQFLNCGLSGTIPSSLSLLPDLGVLILSGYVPLYLFFFLLLYYNVLYYIFIVANTKYTSINLVLFVYINFRLKLNGSIPESFGSFKSELGILRLDTNGLSGPIPKSLGQANINQLYLNHNQFTGDASFLFTSDKPMERVILSDNHFKFNFSYVDLPWRLNYIDLSYNELYGSLPRRLGQLQLRYVNFRNNQLCGKFPKGRRLKQFSPIGFTNNMCLCDAPGLPPCNK
ncbi:polygalacturonase inhibitor-like [Chenopodium quinoa]|uniref:polygalacturonase inhibitor-like n=1 Tax=Chenopodium quinoa TaxID=63459 RepID=UPI000B77DB38|nr:polygalacturonase inhibitor-like [Chenopodium quinoa]